jgi:hypothetical protein
MFPSKRRMTMMYLLKVDVVLVDAGAVVERQTRAKKRWLAWIQQRAVKRDCCCCCSC